MLVSPCHQICVVAWHAEPLFSAWNTCWLKLKMRLSSKGIFFLQASRITTITSMAHYHLSCLFEDTIRCQISKFCIHYFPISSSSGSTHFSATKISQPPKQPHQSLMLCSDVVLTKQAALEEAEIIGCNHGIEDPLRCAGNQQRCGADWYQEGVSAFGIEVSTMCVLIWGDWCIGVGVLGTEMEKECRRNSISALFCWYRFVAGECDPSAP